jgi:hypothetical protein
MLAENTQRTHHRPWSDRTDALEAEHGHWADFVAWERWMGEQPARLPGTLGEDLEDAWGAMDGLARSALYVVMCEAVDFGARGAL